MIENNFSIEFPKNFNYIINKSVENGFVIKFPKNRYTFTNVYSLLFVILCMLMFIFLTIKFTYTEKFLIFLATSLFWYTQIKQAIGNIIYLFEEQTLTLVKDQFTLEKKLFNKCSMVSCEISSIDSIYLKNRSMSFMNFFNLNNRLLYLSVTKQYMGTFDIPNMIIDGKEIMFFETLKHKEQKWLVNFLNEYIHSFKQKK